MTTETCSRLRSTWLNMSGPVPCFLRTSQALLPRSSLSTATSFALGLRDWAINPKRESCRLLITESRSFDPRFVLVALQPKDAEFFSWPIEVDLKETVGTTLVDLMAANGWPGAEAWARKAAGIAPTIVGGSKKHGGPDLGPTRARLRWRQLGVDGLGIADAAPDASFPEDKVPRLTVKMVARIQSFPDEWHFTGGKTWAYRQVGNAFPPQVARCVGISIMNALNRRRVQANGNGRLVEMRLLDRPRLRNRPPFQFKPRVK